MARGCLRTAGLAVAACVAAAAAPETAWVNWDGRQTCDPTAIVQPTTEAQIVSLVTAAASSGQQIKVAGDGHSFSPIVLTNGTLLQLDAYASVLSLDAAGLTVTVQAGIRLYALNAYLAQQGFALANLGAISQQSVAGATSTNTHGTGPTGGLATFITALTIVLANGTVAAVSPTQNAGLFDAVRVGMGGFGVLSTLTLAIVPLWRMEKIEAPVDLDTLMAQLPALLAQFERLQWFWTPYTTNATLLLRVNTSAPITAGCWNSSAPAQAPVSPPPAGWKGWPAGTTGCVDDSYRTLTAAGDDAVLYTEMEMMVPAGSALDAVRDFRAYQDSVKHEHDPAVSLFTGVRYVVADGIWLSPFYGRDTAVISMIVFGNATVTGPPAEVLMYDSGLEGIAMKRYGGRPHPGKNNYAIASELVGLYPQYGAFVALRNSLDPAGVFMNTYLRTWFGAP
jgi:FAD/FMN-containing dehydrogenase